MPQVTISTTNDGGLADPAPVTVNVPGPADVVAASDAAKAALEAARAVLAAAQSDLASKSDAEAKADAALGTLVHQLGGLIVPAADGNSGRVLTPAGDAGYSVATLGVVHLH